ncbi:putative quinol monooxygenase [Sedimentitalea todarodis]|uniref:Quinol monooxygenase n=1 Tax=Sedimentitalea todarodis TaxID=1631240 RepID=A0ABU3VDC1_9RHOB|nr:putative quinol monooxygenase [Sedimentitalea todarodis]MDU9003734.1 putative quinol monooxygenase [Sedimentitalea todarodis]
MLIVTGIIEINPDRIGSAQAAATKMMVETRKESGCHVYEFSQQVEAPHRFRVYEEWSDDAALQAHSEAPHMAAFREALGEIGVISREIVKFDAGERVSI